MRLLSLILAVAALGASGCSVKLLDKNESPSVANTCHATSDCGSSASCINGACVASSSTIDQVLVEVIPDSQSEFGGLSFVSTLDGVGMGDSNRVIDLPSATQLFTPQVKVNPADPTDYTGCMFDSVGSQPVAARIEYTRSSSVGGVLILGLPTVSVIVETPAKAPLSLFPGTYDIYVQPVSSAQCDLAPAMMRGVVVSEDAPSSAAHAIIDLPKPKVLNGTVLRKGGTLVGWTIDVIEPQDGRVISTVGRIGATSMNFVTNFGTVTYQPPSIPHTGISPGASDIGAGSPLIRLTPPPEMVAFAPTVYWNLATVDINGDGKLSLDMTGVPIPDQLVEVTGQVKGGDAGVRSSVRFFSISLEGALGITAVFNPSVVTDDQGRYTIKLFPGQYRAVATPDLTTQNALAATPSTMGSPAPSGASVANPWAISEQWFSIVKTVNVLPPLSLSPKILLHGTALSNPNDAPAVGATFEAVPSILLTKVGVLRSALAQTPALPPSASVPIVDDKMGTFSLPVDPGNFDLSLRPADTSNFAWWVSPATSVTPTTRALIARLPLPVPIEGIITIPSRDDPTNMTRVVLRNASLRAYAKVPSGTGVTKVGETRTDDSGHYSLGLPASFGP